MMAHLRWLFSLPRLSCAILRFLAAWSSSSPADALLFAPVAEAEPLAAAVADDGVAAAEAEAEAGLPVAPAICAEVSMSPLRYAMSSFLSTVETMVAFSARHFMT